MINLLKSPQPCMEVVITWLIFHGTHKVVLALPPPMQEALLSCHFLRKIIQPYIIYFSICTDITMLSTAFVEN